ncbi:MAG: sigma-70 family RNA polymerase sigma factor [Planctomycetota bacterium]|nr:sigma-70 family RNA polymerase sigma factor [Planctomycetota bacterium]
MSDDVPFSELLERARQGDRAARDALFAQLAGEEGADSPLLAMARKALPKGDLARDFVESQDLVQSALRSGWLDLSQFQGTTEASLFAWMRTILRHKLSHTVRRKRPRPGHTDAIEPDPHASDAPAERPIETAIREETYRRVRDAVDGLPDDQRVVMERRLAGKAAPEVAEELGLTPAAVRKRESRAMARLRAVLGTPPNA